ncbi:hypothetical protein D6827_00265 [Candidatus Parcubacteria bacterium]|nr:MAG: hypothetical protein D6827_00265 [Candidatus Parcubacteria bacterium]
MRKYWELILGIAVILIVALIVFWAPEKGPAYAPVDVGGGSISVTDQPASDSVVLNAELAAPGFITVHSAIGDAPGPIIGVSDYLPVGKYDNLQIPLSESLRPNFRYITLLHADNGDQVFVIDDDLPVMVDGAVVRPDFTALPN